MNDSDYRAILRGALERLAAAAKERDELETECSKLRQFIMATINMLPDEDRSVFMKAYDEVAEFAKSKDIGLKRACLNVLVESSPEYLTATQVRDKLLSSGFDFSEYTTNPLASISTTLRRCKPEEAEETTVQGVTAYRAVVAGRKTPKFASTSIAARNFGSRR
jgi:hypothetical protein